MAVMAHNTSVPLAAGRGVARRSPPGGATRIRHTEKQAENARDALSLMSVMLKKEAGLSFENPLGAGGSRWV